MNKAVCIVAGIVVFAAVGMVMVKQETVASLTRENEQLKLQAAAAQDQAAHSEQDAAAATGEATSRETQMRDLVRLRAEVAALRKATNELAKARQQIDTLNQRIAQDAEEKQGIIAAASAEHETSRRSDAMNACINNLRLIDAAKQQWALEQRKTPADTPTWDDLRPYLGHGPNGDLPVCPGGGTYTIATVAEKPTCNVPGHVLP